MKIFEVFNKKEFDIEERDIKLILSNILNLQINELFLNKDRELTKKQLKLFLNSIKKRKNGIPVSKIFNTKFFWESEFFVNYNVLDPRNDSEILIENIIKKFSNRKNENLKILDLGTGSGCLVLSLLKEFKNYTAIAIDIDKKALNVAKFNAINLDLHKRIEFIQNNWNDNLNEKFDIIISNPPYIKTNDIKELEKEVKFYDPYMALNGGDNGLECYEYLAKNLKKNCNKNANIFFEIGFGQLEDIKNIFIKNNFIFIESYKDLNGIIRIVEYTI